jgi:hypothetical protein
MNIRAEERSECAQTFLWGILNWELTKEEEEGRGEDGLVRRKMKSRAKEKRKENRVQKREREELVLAKQMEGGRDGTMMGWMVFLQKGPMIGWEKREKREIGINWRTSAVD